MERNRVLIITHCNECCHFDNHYYGYNERCKLLGSKITTISFDGNGGRRYCIPTECPLPLAGEVQ